MKSFLKIFLFIFAMIATVGEVKSSTVAEKLIHLAADNASIGDIEDALSSKNYEYSRDASVEGGFRVDTEKQYKGWAMMQIFSPDNVSAIFGITAGTGGAAEKVAGRSAARGVSRVVAKEAAKTGANLSTNGVKLAKQLASEAQMTGKGIQIINSDKLGEATRLAQQYGGEIKDWVKMSSSSFTKNGVTFETHWYENIATGIRVEFKTKFP